MKKSVKPITALFLVMSLFLSLSITGCSGSPDDLPSELVSVDFEDLQSTGVSDPQDSTTNGSDDTEADDESSRAYKRLLSLGTGNVLCDAEDGVEYNGGTLELPCTVKYSCQAEEITEPRSVGCLVAINGVLQKVSCGEQKDEYMYIESFEKDDFRIKDGRYVSSKQIKLSFEPQINEEDKELTKLQLSVIVVDSPLFRLEPEYPMARLVHRTATSSVRTITLNSPITKYTEDRISDGGFTELELTEEVAEQYSTMLDIHPKNLTENTVPFANVDADGYSSYCFTEDGALNLGFITSVEEDSGSSNYKHMVQGRYLVSMFVNGSPHAFPDGSMYKSVDMEPGKLYVYEAEDFSGILNECDTIVFFFFFRLRDDGKCILTQTVMAYAVLPKDKESWQ